MKKTITTITLGLLFSLSTFATVRTVNNFITNAAQYSDLQTAIQASAVGDTILIHGSPINYGNIILNRKLCLMGAGSNLNNFAYNYNTKLNSIYVDTINSIPQLTITGFSLHGIEFGSLSFTSVSGHPVGNKANDVIISRCRSYNLNVNGRNWLIKNNFLSVINISRSISVNIMIANNIITSNIDNGIATSNFAPYIIIINNILTASNSSYLFNTLIANNIFINSIPAPGSSGNIYNNNITFTGTPTQLNLPPTNNTGTGNFNNTNPNFINVPAPASLSITPNLANYNFSFPPTSSAYNAGTDGTNIGITGGPYPWNGINLDGRAQIPLMQELNINNSVINQGDPLNIQFKARKNN